MTRRWPSGSVSARRPCATIWSIYWTSWGSTPGCRPSCWPPTTASSPFSITVLDLLVQGQTVAVRWEARSGPGSDPVRGRSDGALGRVGDMTFGHVVRGRTVQSWTHWEAGGDVGGPWRTVGEPAAGPTVS